MNIDEHEPAGPRRRYESDGVQCSTRRCDWDRGCGYAARAIQRHEASVPGMGGSSASSAAARNETEKLNPPSSLSLSPLPKLKTTTRTRPIEAPCIYTVGGMERDRSGGARTHAAYLAAEAGADESPEVSDDVLAAALRLPGGVDAQHDLAGGRLRGAQRVPPDRCRRRRPPRHDRRQRLARAGAGAAPRPRERPPRVGAGHEPPAVGSLDAAAQVRHCWSKRRNPIGMNGKCRGRNREEGFSFALRCDSARQQKISGDSSFFPLSFSSGVGSGRVR
jgi:hypothetical protein